MRNFKGLSGFQLKLFALIVMTMDHLAGYLPASVGVPDWFHLFGRLAAPIFIYLCAEGFYYTRSRGRYLARLYAASALMKLGNFIININFRAPSGAVVANDMFTTMFMICWMIWAFELVCKRGNTRKQRIIGGAMLLAPVLSTAVLLTCVSLPNQPALNLIRLLMTLLPTPLFCEGGPVWVALGLLFYLTRKNKLLTALVLAVICGGQMILAPHQWLSLLCVFASIIPIWLYNGTPGKHRCKWLFYIYYPAHVYLIYLAGWWIATH